MGFKGLLAGLKLKLGLPAMINNVRLYNFQDFLYYRNLLNRGIKVESRKDKEFVARWLNFKIIAPWQCSTLINDFEKTYGFIDYHNKKVLDIGGFIEDTALYFVHKGAKYVIVYEPIFCNYLEKNVKLNNLCNRVKILCKGVGLKEGSVKIGVNSVHPEASGLKLGENKIEIEPVSEVLKRHNVDIAKFDCESCEYFLISVPCEILRKIPDYIIEYHGSSVPLIHKFEECNFKLKKVMAFHDTAIGIGLLYFTL